jgi:voltage-gated potassium channel
MAETFPEKPGFEKPGFEKPDFEKLSPGIRGRLHEIIFEADTLAGRWFDVTLTLVILTSVAVVMLESVASVRHQYGPLLLAAEWVFTVLFTIEYVLRLWTVRSPIRYATSFYGVIDLLSVIPTYLSLLLPGAQSLLVLRSLRLLRIFRIFKLAQYTFEAQTLTQALRASRRKIIVFLAAISTLVLIAGAMMYVIEGEKNGFTSIPTSVYWAIVTMTTVGFGDITPKTPLGQILASLMMITGYGIIAVPTGIVSVELARAATLPINTQACPHCGRQGHDVDAVHCKFCGARLHI